VVEEARHGLREKLRDIRRSVRDVLGDRPRFFKSYPLSRLLTTKLNPFALLPRWMAARGLLGRLKDGRHLTGNDRRSIRRLILEHQPTIDLTKAHELAKEVVRVAKEGRFRDPATGRVRGKKYPWSRLFTMRSPWGVLTGICALTTPITTGAVVGAALAGAEVALDIHIGRVIHTRALAGREYLEQERGGPLKWMWWFGRKMKSEQHLLDAIDVALGVENATSPP
jgi:hypothetical protein